MERREALKYISILLGGSVVGGNAFLMGCKSETGKEMNFTTEDIAYLDEVADTILPDTSSSPGARAAKVGQFMTVMVNDCYEEIDQKAFHAGFKKLDDASKKKFDNGFMKLTPEQRHDLLVEVDKEAKEYQAKKIAVFNEAENKKQAEEKAKGKVYKKQRMAPHYFTMMKQLTLLGYFTSEIGYTKARRYAPVPGRYDACVPYNKGDKAWA
jgi:hypothetical protein